MRKREVIFVLIAIIAIAVQVYFDLKIPEYIDQMTVIATNLDQDQNQILQIGTEMFLCLISSLILSVVAGYCSSRAAAGYAYSLRKELFSKILNFGEREVSKFTIPSLIIRCTNDITQIQLLIAMGLQIIVRSPIMAVWAITKIIGKNWQLSMLVACFVIAVIIFIFATMFIVLPKFRIIQKLTDKINLLARENIIGINIIHAFNAENYQKNKFEKVNSSLTKTQLFNQRVFSVLVPLISAAMSCLWFSIYWLGAALLIPLDVAERVYLFGDIVAFAMYATYVLTSFMMMTMIFIFYPPAQASGERIQSVLDSKILIKEGAITEVKKNSSNIIEFKNVNFSFNKYNKLLKNINFRIERGQSIGIIGSTGSGKTTLADLMMRFYDVDSGKILIDGINIKDYSFNLLYKKISMATQKPIVFYGSVRENIEFGQEKIDDIKLNQILDVAQCSEFVDKLPDKKETIISQDGKNISGGQKQRLSIARAISRDPEVLILDDTLSALDYKTDAKLRNKLKKYMSKTTVVMISQRIGTIKNADKIIVIENGEIVGIGKHKELLKTCKEYKEIADSQIK